VDPGIRTLYLSSLSKVKYHSVISAIDSNLVRFCFFNGTKTFTNFDQFEREVEFVCMLCPGPVIHYILRL